MIFRIINCTISLHKLEFKYRNKTCEFEPFVYLNQGDLIIAIGTQTAEFKFEKIHNPFMSECDPRAYIEALLHYGFSQVTAESWPFPISVVAMVHSEVDKFMNGKATLVIRNCAIAAGASRVKISITE